MKAYPWDSHLGVGSDKASRTTVSDLCQPEPEAR